VANGAAATAHIARSPMAQHEAAAEWCATHVSLTKADQCAHDCPSGERWLHDAMQPSPAAWTIGSVVHAATTTAAHAATHLTAAPIRCRRAALTRMSIAPPPCGTWPPTAAMMPRRAARGQNI